jgi:tetratricopeptide (TPR) repeat protein
MFSVVPEIIIILAILGIIIVIIRRLPNAAGVPLKTSASQQKLFAETSLMSKILNYFSNLKKRVAGQLKKASLEKKTTQVPKENSSSSIKASPSPTVFDEVKTKKEVLSTGLSSPKPGLKKNIQPESEKKKVITFSSGNREQEILEKIVEHPKDPQSYKELAELYSAQGNYNDAIKALKEVLKISPNDLMAEEKMNQLIELQKKL